MLSFYLFVYIGIINFIFFISESFYNDTIINISQNNSNLKNLQKALLT